MMESQLITAEPDAKFQQKFNTDKNMPKNNASFWRASSPSAKMMNFFQFKVNLELNREL